MNELKRPLSPDELQMIWKKHHNNNIPIVMYDSVINAKDISKLFKTSDVIILYYPLMRDGTGIMGHYVALVNHPDTIYYYDSYGFRPDGIKKTRIHDDLYKEHENSLIRLLLNAGKQIDFSHYKHQSTKEGIATCGRHSLLRCMLGNLSNDQYNKWLKTHKGKNASYDNLVVNLI